MAKDPGKWGKDVHGRVYDKPHTAGIGNERKADVRGVQEGGSRAEARGSVIHDSEGRGPVGHTHLRHAVRELHEQHPHRHGHHDAPHHRTSMETKDHHRHMPLHGMKPHKGKH